MNDLGALNDPLALRVQAREELDLRVGYAYTRFLTMLFRTRLPHALSPESGLAGQEHQDRVISYGPCQTPALFLVCQRNERRLDAITKEPDMLEMDLEVEVNAGNGNASGRLQCAFA